MHSLLQAVRLLKTAKMMEGPLRKREVILENLQTVLVQIQMAETDAKVGHARHLFLFVLVCCRLWRHIAVEQLH